MSKNKKIILSALMLALFIILDRLITINTKFLTINLSLLPIMILAMVLGWKYATLIGALGDLLGAIFWPFGPYFFGFTLSSALTGLVFGLFLYEKQLHKKTNFILRAIVSNIIVAIVINLLLNSLWLNIMYGKSFIYFVGVRAVTQLIMLPIYVILIVLIEKNTKELVSKYLYKEEQ